MQIQNMNDNEKKDIQKLTEMVEAVLRDLPASRDSDITLTIEIWRRFYPEKLKGGLSGMPQYVYLEDLFEMPREDNIKRIRAKFQNERGLYPPTTWEIAEARGMKAEQWRAALGYATNYKQIDIQ